MIDPVNALTAFGTIIIQAVLLMGVICFFLPQTREKILYVLTERALLIVTFLLAFVGGLISLYYSNIAGFPPCDLCWYQRIFLYPLIILLGIALWKNDFRVHIYTLPLSILGSLFALYHSYITYGGATLGLCNVIGVGVSCTRRYVFEMGYITIPLMSLSLFLILTFLLIVLKKRGNA